MREKELDYHPLTLWNVPEEHDYFYKDMGGLYSHMFTEDVTNNIAPFSSHSSRNKKSFEAIVSDDSLELELKTLFHLPYSDSSSYEPLSNVVFGFIREVSGFLLGRGGRCFFEIVDATLKDGDMSKSLFVLKPVQGRVTKFWGTYYQAIPKDRREGNKKYIAVPQSKIWILETPKELGNIKGIIALSDNLGKLEDASLLGSNIVMSQKEYYGFEFNKFHRRIDAEILQATNKWGWDMRMAINNQHALEYFMFYRMLRFSHSLAVLRTDILSKMNILLKRLGYDVTVSFSGIPTPKDYLDAIKKMEERRLSFKEASDLVHYSL
ncbi:MAG: hypothetical protein IPP66_22395 [Anaerolineales bacterium]|nr:hypothetical protein [Anaerolineales bacterium]